MVDSSSGVRIDSMAEQPAPPLTHRRPRVKEVSSRFMSPLLQSNSTPKPSDYPRSKSVCRRLMSRAYENHDPMMDKPSGSNLLTGERKPHHPRVKQNLKENGEIRDGHQSEARIPVRPDTPIVMSRDRVVPSRYKQVSNSVHRSPLRSSRAGSSSAVTAADRLLQEATSDAEEKLSRISMSSADDIDSCSTATSSNQGTSSCPNSPLCVPNTKMRSSSSMRSSMPDVDKWRNFSNHVKSASDCARSLNFSSSGKAVSLPPHPSSQMRAGLDIKKGKKVSSHSEDVHCLKMLHNHYLQWRLANAKAETSVHAQRQEAEKKLCSLSQNISKMRDNVTKKQKELALLRRIKTLTFVVESQMLYLDEWSAIEEDYAAALSVTINALLISSIRIPISGDVRVDSGELREALGSALKVLDSICPHMQRFLQKAEATDASVSELAKVAGGERALIEECRYLVSKAYVSQVKECSLRSSVIQIGKSNNEHQTEESRSIIEKHNRAYQV